MTTLITTNIIIIIVQIMHTTYGSAVECKIRKTRMQSKRSVKETVICRAQKSAEYAYNCIIIIFLRANTVVTSSN